MTFTLVQWIGLGVLVLVAIGAWTQRRAVSRWLDRCAEEL